MSTTSGVSTDPFLINNWPQTRQIRPPTSPTAFRTIHHDPTSPKATNSQQPSAYSEAAPLTSRCDQTTAPSITKIDWQILRRPLYDTQQSSSPQHPRILEDIPTASLLCSLFKDTATARHRRHPRSWNVSQTSIRHPSTFDNGLPTSATPPTPRRRQLVHPASPTFKQPQRPNDLELKAEIRIIAAHRCLLTSINVSSLHL